MFKKIFTVILFAISFSGEIHAQKAYWVFFTDKNGTSFDPYSYFAPEAITRRQKLGISLYDSTDFPVNANYLSQVGTIVDHLGYTTRWFNGVGVIASDEEVSILQKLSFVREVVPQAEWIIKPASVKLLPDSVSTEEANDRDLKKQIDPMQGKSFADHNLKGKGIIISIIDVGFHGVDVSPAFKDLRFNNQIRSTFDFGRDNMDVYSPSADHGTMVLSCIAGYVDGKQMGLAPEATFLLAKISTAWTSQPQGEENFVKAVEWSDQQGAMIINCSDGPDKGTYFPEQMDGKKSLMSRTSNMAARKGILVIAAAGNEGESEEPNLLPPADADSVLSVTALNDDGYIASYSSYGPTPDFRHKPDVSAPGTALVADGYSDYSVEEGTSFSAPLLVGFAACVIEKYPDLSPMMLADSMRKSSSLYPFYDYSHGYGTPQASYFFNAHETHPPTFTLTRVENSALITIDEKYKPDCGSSPYPKLYYSLEDSHGRIYKYDVYTIVSGNPITIPEVLLKAGVKVNVFYKGYYASLQF